MINNLLVYDFVNGVMPRKYYPDEQLVLKDFSYQELAGANFNNAILMACDFRGAFLHQASFANATLITCDFRGADLSRADFRIRSARSCSFAHANLSNVNWGGEEHLGNPDCLHNARSPYLRCAINPFGPCEKCEHFEVMGAESA